MNVNDLGQIRYPADLTIAPDGGDVVYQLASIDVDHDRYRHQLWRVPAGGGTPVRITEGDDDTAPVYSPDGRWLAFRRGGQAHVQLAAGGEPVPVSTVEHHPLGVGPLVWSPDSTRLAYPARTPRPDPRAPRRITALDYRRDGLGYLDQPRRLYVVRPGDDPIAITDGYDDYSPAWSPDGRHLAFVSARHPGRGRDMITDIFAVPADGGREPRRLTQTQLALDRPRYTPDGQTLWCTGMELGDNGHDWFAQPTGVYRVPVDACQPPQRMEDPRGRTHDGVFCSDRDAVLFGGQDRGAVHLLRYPATGEPDVVIGGHQHVLAAATSAAGTIAAIVATPTSFGDIVLDGRTLTAYSAHLAVHEPRELTATAPDGYPVHGWLTTPGRPGPHPLILMVHGGPYAQYGWRLFDEAQIYTAAGYAVLLGNPRGSSGYGYHHGRYVIGNVGHSSATDLLALLDRALTDAHLDPDRLAVIGGSHGGYMATWLAAHTDRFTTAVSERSINALDSYLATADLGWAFTSLYGHDPHQLLAQSPLTYADHITIPLLIIHSDNDLRAPLEQAQRLHHALARRGARVELLTFPDEGHDLSRNGTPRHRTERFQAILDWLDRTLRT